MYAPSRQSQTLHLFIKDFPVSRLVVQEPQGHKTIFRSRTERIESGVVHSERLEDVLLHVVFSRLVDDVGQNQPEPSVSVEVVRC